MNADPRTEEQKITFLEAKNLALESKLSDADAKIEGLEEQIASLKDEIKDLSDYDDDEIRHEFEARQIDGPLDYEYRRLAEHIVAGETDAALSSLAEISNGSVNPAVVKMLAKAHAQEALL